MTRTEYLEQLDNHLRKLPKTDYEEAMAYFTEYFDEAGEENEALVMAELGTPREAASELIHNLLDRRMGDDKYPARSKTQVIWLVILALFAIPIGVPAILAILGTLFALVAAAIALTISAILTSISLLIGAGIGFFEGFAYLTQSASLSTLSFGSGLAMLGAALLIGLLTIFLNKLAFQGIKALVKWIITKGKRA